jgi:hypothetical protein
MDERKYRLTSITCPCGKRAREATVVVPLEESWRDRIDSHLATARCPRCGRSLASATYSLSYDQPGEVKAMSKSPTKMIAPRIERKVVRRYFSPADGHGIEVLEDGTERSDWLTNGTGRSPYHPFSDPSNPIVIPLAVVRAYQKLEFRKSVARRAA